MGWQDLFCPATFDGWGCWDATSAGDVAEIPCPSEGNSSRKVKKRCSENGYWEINADTREEKVDYRECNINVSNFVKLENFIAIIFLLIFSRLVQKTDRISFRIPFST
ncbi:calcitonin gene-related peptide type 1 receptor [Caerostris darwini]|uniref:Calcitonin gene-related peptide type 1 receptor n=1 Tax=Caerostris darwini TaxID=1538125 RepID=A0AAV4RHK9_9ARAC|nr:calcitonin gene-related peptide type 1 receptor [Caerostris darwini]